LRRSSEPTWSASEALDILREEGADEWLIRHCIAVFGVSVYLASLIMARGRELDMGLVMWGSLLHDLGRTRTHGPEHGYVSGQMLRERGLGRNLVRLVERHVGGGIDAEEASKLGLPKRDYVPETIEEKLVCYADKLIASSKVVPFETALRRYSKLLGRDHPGVERMTRLHEEFGKYVG